jgi:tetratricopeptide (TPR) repeat protein
MSNKDFNLDNDAFSDDFFSGLLSRFEQMYNEKDYTFFDSDELEEIINYYLTTEELSYAEYAIEIALKQFPNSTEFLCFHAQCIHLQGESDKAIELLNELEDANPETIEIFILLGEIFRDTGKSVQSIRYFEKALSLADEEEVADIVEQIIDSLYESGQHNRIIPYYKKLLKIQPNNSSAMSGLAFCFTMLNREEEGIHFFQKIIENNHFNEIAWFCLGNLFFDCDLYEKSIEAFDYVLAIEPNYTTASIKKGYAYISLKNIDDAINIFVELLNTEDDDFSIYIYLAYCYSLKGDYNTSLDYYLKVIEIDPEMTEAHIGIGYGYAELGQYDFALKHIRIVLDDYEDSDEIWEYRAFLEEKVGLFTDACMSFDKCIELNPENTTARLDYSSLLIDELDDFERAKAVIDEGLKFDTMDVHLIYRMAAIHFEAGLEQEATQWLHTALAIDKQSIQLLYDYSPQLLLYPKITEIISLYN